MELRLEPTLKVILQGLAPTYTELTTVGGGDEILGVSFFWEKLIVIECKH